MSRGAPSTARGGETRSALLEVAARLLEEGGMGAVTLRAVGERAGVSRQAPYNYFADKATLLGVLAARYLGRLDEEMSGAAGEAGEDAFEAIGAMTEAYVRFALESPSRYRLIGQEMSGPRREVHRAARAVHERFVQTVAACQEAGELPGGDPVELAAILFATIHGAVELTLSGHDEEEKGLGDPAELVRGLLARLRRDGRSLQFKRK